MRPTLDATMITMARAIAERSTCRRRKVGCVMVDQYGRVVGVGHNGVARGRPHCIEAACPGSGLPSGRGLDLCEAIHAEQNALMFCGDVMLIATAYVTAAPCAHCLKMLLNTSAGRIVYDEDYPGDALALWRRAGRVADRAAP